MIAIFDRVMWLYLFAIIVCAYGFGLFIWWWYKVKDASAVYVYVTLLFIGQGFSYALQFWTRYLRSSDEMAAYNIIVNSDIWFLRLFAPVICLFAIVAHMTWRVINDRKNMEG